MKQAIGHSVAVVNDNLIMTPSAAPHMRRVRNVLRAPFSRRARAEIRYALITLPLAIAAAAFTAAMIGNGILWAVSADGMRGLASASRFLARELLSEDVPAPPRLRSVPGFRVRTRDAKRLAQVAADAKGRVHVWETRPGVTIRRLPRSRLIELAAEAGITIDLIQPTSPVLSWMAGRILDPATWRARGYFALKLPLAVVAAVIAAAGWVGGLFCLTYPAWWSLAQHGVPGAHQIVNFAGSFIVPPIGAALLLAAPGLLHGVTEADRWLMRGLLGPVSPAERIRALEESRASAVDDSAARLRGIERDLHDGTQAQLVALAMKLGLATEKLHEGAHLDLARVTQLVEDAHRGVLEAISDLRTLARGIHPPVLDNGLVDALATLVNRSSVPVELIADIPERPSEAIETIAYFSAAELLTNVAKHSGARHATLEAVHVSGLLRIRVHDDGHGGARRVSSGGLLGLAARVRTVDGRLEIDSPRGGPTTVTVELPSHA